MFETIKRLYSKTHNKAVVDAAVAKGWITAGQYKEITGETYQEGA